MKSTRKLSLPFSVLMLGALACATQATFTPAPDVNALNTTVAETVAGALTLSAVPGSPLPTETSTLTFTPGPPTLTPTQTSTVTPFFTPTPPIPLISVDVATNCRSGPGKVYSYKGALLVGEVAQVLARDPSGEYWLIRNPESETDSCWIWGEYATITGNFSVLPVYTPPPTPTPTFTPTPSPDFEVTYTSLDTCVGWWVELKVKNIGMMDFRSVEITIKDMTTDIDVTNLTDGFIDVDGCLSSSARDVLLPGKATVVSAAAFLYDPSGHEMRAIVTLCTNTGHSGTCIKRKIEFGL